MSKGHLTEGACCMFLTPMNQNIQRFVQQYFPAPLDPIAGTEQVDGLETQSILFSRTIIRDRVFLSVLPQFWIFHWLNC